jgi:hypothetical protein
MLLGDALRGHRQGCGVFFAQRQAQAFVKVGDNLQQTNPILNTQYSIPNT